MRRNEAERDAIRLHGAKYLVLTTKKDRTAADMAAHLIHYRHHLEALYVRPGPFIAQLQVSGRLMIVEAFSPP